MDIVWPLLIAIISIALCNLLLIPLRYIKKARRLENQELLKTGLSGEAEILGYKTSMRYHKQIVVYRFQSENGQLVVCEKAIGRHENQLPAGSKVPVKYMARYPAISILLPYAKTQEASS